MKLADGLRESTNQVLPISPEHRHLRIRLSAKGKRIGQAPPPAIGVPCMAVVKSLTITEEYYRDELRWHAFTPQTLVCARLAVVNVGFNACAEHGAGYLAEQLCRQVQRARPGTAHRWHQNGGTPKPSDFPMAELWERDGGRPTYYLNKGKRNGGGDHFNAHLLELGYRVVEPLWRLFEEAVA